MKKLIATLSLALLGVAPWMSVQAANYCDPCCDPCCTPCCNCCGSFEVGGEALYWKACTDNPIYAVTAIVESESKNDFLLAVKAHPYQDRYQWGFRLFAAYFTCDLCNYVRLEWTYLDTHKNIRKEANNENNEFLSLPNVAAAKLVGTFDRAHAKTKVCYNAVDLEGGHRLVFCGCGPSNSCDPCCGFSAYLFASLRYVDVDNNQHAHFVDETNLGKYEYNDFLWIDCKNRFRGGGPRLGLRFRSDVWCGLGIVGKIGTSVLLGSRHSRLRFKFKEQREVSSFSEAEIVFSNSSGGICVPQIDAKLGVDYCFSCCGTFIIEAGWAWEHMWAGMSNLVFDGLSLQNRIADFGVGGPYIRAAYRF